ALDFAEPAKATEEAHFRVEVPPRFQIREAHGERLGIVARLQLVGMLPARDSRRGGPRDEPRHESCSTDSHATVGGKRTVMVVSAGVVARRLPAHEDRPEAGAAAAV